MRVSGCQSRPVGQSGLLGASARVHGFGLQIGPAGSRFGPKLEGRPGCGVTGQARLAGRVIGLRRLAGRAAMVLSGRRVVLGWGARFGLVQVNRLGRNLAGWVKNVRWAC